MKADRLSVSIEILVVKESKVTFGYTKPSYQFKGRLQDGHIGLEDDSRRLQPQTTRISVRNHRNSDSQNQAVLAAGTSRMTKIRVG
jgi:hypothetical protein